MPSTFSPGQVQTLPDGTMDKAINKSCAQPKAATVVTSCYLPSPEGGCVWNPGTSAFQPARKQGSPTWGTV